MYQSQIMPLTRLASTSSLFIRNIFPSCAILNKACNYSMPTQFMALNAQTRQTIHTTPSINKLAINFISNDNFFSKSYDSFRFHYFRKHIYKGKAYLLYRNTCDSLDYIQFIKDFEMPDTYFSWFLITELHVWMLMVKLIDGGRAGMVMREHVVGAMWHDADCRKNQLGTLRKSVVIQQMKTLGYQFRAAVISYDEGLMTDDRTLAGALWRRFFLSECTNPEYLEKLIIYIRKNINMLDNTPIDDIIAKNRVNLIDRHKC